MAVETPPEPPGSARSAATGRDALTTAVDDTLIDFLSTEMDALDVLDPGLRQFAQIARDSVLTGGKRLRPVFAHWGWRGVVGTGPPLAPILPALAALELLHAFALVHDDVMDASATRRGRPTAHRRLAGQHRASGRTGDPVRFGDAAAVLVGDLCLVWADRLLAASGVPATTMLAVRRCYDQMRIDTIAGQYLDVLGESDAGNWSVERALRVARHKTASYTVTGPMHLGAALAGAVEPALAGAVEPASTASVGSTGGSDHPGQADAVRTAYTRYGGNVGEAFQLRDDLLGVFGDPAVTGKPAGDDLRTGKPTVLLLLARELATRHQAAALDALPVDTAGTGDGDDGSEEQTRQRVARLAEIVVETGAAAQVERMIERRVMAGVSALTSAPIDDTARGVLTDLAVAATTRQA
ncbi:polyprenyl synthetase family protein [Solwaraspora sp. WMMD406]|uniref:polyprenyl synthetase family protein n=1 Tax=Solwaraspora sp. WMMD406 TaxID=3016095 RepID=UPI002417EC81|nr:polyprenyl synthetase family protein [Solwaraspora sp. WMMD406]MDG4763150.1 polyprenyl synthetase family protein [Solwaraspora sp. WMMD406]